MKRDKIRLGMVRCSDIHGYYFAVFIEDCDPVLLSKNYYIVHHYATNIYDPKKITLPKVEGFKIVKVWDYDYKKAEIFSETFLDKPKVCKNLEEMLDGIDAVFIADGEDDGSDHLKLATPFIKRGIPVFVDKPFASSLKDAKGIVRLAQKYKTPIFNASILTYVPAAEQFKKRFGEIATGYYPVPSGGPYLPVGLGIIKGVGGTFSQELAGKSVKGGLKERMAYIIHGISLALNLFGLDVEWVETMGTSPLEYIHLHMKSGMEVIVINTSTDIFPEECSFYASAYSKYGAVHSNPIGDPQFIGGAKIILEILKKMVLTGKPPVPYENFILHIGIIEAAQIAQKERRKVSLKEVL